MNIFKKITLMLSKNTKILFEKIVCYFKKEEEGSLDYIVALPTPLNKEDEEKAILDYEKGSEEAKNILITHNLRLVVYIAKRFDNTGMDMEELISVGTLGLIKAIKSYNLEKKIKLATYASRCIENEILMYLRKMVKNRQLVSLDEPLNVDYEGNQLLLSDILGTDPDAIYKEVESKLEKSVLKEVFKTLEKRDQLILCLRYGLYGFQEKTQKEIADLLNISQSYISRIEKKIIDKLRSDFVKQEIT